MCTAITLQTKDFYFGRNLDLHYSYEETVTVTPRNYPFSFRCGITLPCHFAMIGMATVAQDYPLYYEATNEKGLSMAGLNFPGNAVYYPKACDQANIAPFELIPWILGQCSCVRDATALLQKMNLWNEPFSKKYPLTPLHWLIADKTESITVEPLADGLQITQNPVGVLTNNPPFDYHIHNLSNYINLSPRQPENRFSSKLDLIPNSFGMGAIGLPGDLSSQSRFIRAAFGKLNSVCGSSEAESISQFFHILSSVAQLRGLNLTSQNSSEITVYSSCCNTDRGIYYYTTYENSCITAVDMFATDLNGKQLDSYPLRKEQQIFMQNRSN